VKNPKDQFLGNGAFDCMVFGNVGSRLTELLLRKCGIVCVLELGCANRNTMKGMWLKACIMRVLAVCLPNGGCRGGIFRSLGWSDECHRAVAVSDRLLLYHRAVAESAQRDLERVIRALKSNTRYT
jgi:hypothetical protein